MWLSAKQKVAHDGPAGEGSRWGTHGLAANKKNLKLAFLVQAVDGARGLAKKRK